MLPTVAGCCGDRTCAPSLLGHVPPAFQTPSFGVGHRECQAAAGPASSLNSLKVESQHGRPGSA